MPSKHRSSHHTPNTPRKHASRPSLLRCVFAISILLLFTALQGSALPRASLLTALPGDDVYELEGHTALRIHDPEQGVDVVVNWGVFDFNAPNFVGRFVAGETDYLCMAYPTNFFFDMYKEEGRQVIEQTLRLDSIEAQTLVDLVALNLRPENNTYRYNYVLDNCATRPLNHIEAALGRKLLSDSLSATTFRKEMTRYHAKYPWYQFGIDLALGRGLDRQITIRETSFAPIALKDLLANTNIVAETITHGEQTLETHATPWYLTPLCVSILVLLLSIAVTITGKYTKLFDSLMFGTFTILGCILFYLVFFSSHEATSPNLLLLWLNPACALGAVLPWTKTAKRLKICYFFANFALLVALAILAPALGRGMNAAFWPLIAADALRSISHILKCKKTTHS